MDYEGCVLVGRTNAVSPRKCICGFAIAGWVLAIYCWRKICWLYGMGIIDVRDVVYMLMNLVSGL